MNWQHRIDTELSRITPGFHPGKLRTTARRIAGIALQHYYREADGDVLRTLRRGEADHNLSGEVREALRRLAARLDENFSSPSIDPLGDAMLVVDFVRNSPQ